MTSLAILLKLVFERWVGNSIVLSQLKQSFRSWKSVGLLANLNEDDDDESLVTFNTCHEFVSL